MREVINAVVIDNEMKDILGISTALAAHGISTLPVHFIDPTKAKESCRQAAKASPRIIITDIQLLQGGATPSTTDLTSVALCVAELVKSTSGPYILLAWTSKPDSFELLEQRVLQTLIALDLRLPFYFDKISKDDCKISADEYDTDKIFATFRDHLDSKEAVKALLHWESTVASAAIQTVNTLSQFEGDDLAANLRALAIAVAGKKLSGNEATSINQAFSNILSDKISLYSADGHAQSLWKAAIDVGMPETVEPSKHLLNTLLHVETEINSNLICPGDVWYCRSPKRVFAIMTTGGGAANNAAQALKSDIIVLNPTARALEEARDSVAEPAERAMLQQAFQSVCSHELRNALLAAKMVMIETSPLCDFAQDKRPLKSLVLGVLVKVEDLGEFLEIKSSEALVSAAIRHEDSDCIIIFSAKYALSLSEDKINAQDMPFEKIFRIREGLVNSWIQKISSYNSRIGTVSL